MPELNGTAFCVNGANTESHGLSADYRSCCRRMNRPQKGEGFPGQRIVVLPREVLARAGKYPLLCGLLPTDVGYFPKATRHLRERPAGVDTVIFIYCLRGRGWYDLGGNRHLVQAGDLLVIPPKLPHAYGADDKQPWTIHWAHVTGGNVAAVLNELGATVERPVLPLGENPQLLALRGVAQTGIGTALGADLQGQGVPGARLARDRQMRLDLMAIDLHLAEVGVLLGLSSR